MYFRNYGFRKTLSDKSKKSKKSRLTGPFDKQHSQWDQTVLNSEWHNFYHIYWWLWRQLSSKKSLLVVGKILGLFFNTLTPCHKYSLINRENLPQQIKIESYLKRKSFSLFFSIFLKFRWNFEQFQKEITHMADVFWKLRTAKIVVR